MSPVTFGGVPISWKSKLQTMVSLSKVNAKLVALCYTVAETIWLRNLLKEMDLSHECNVWCDSQGALKTIQNPGLLEGTKHIRDKTHFIKQYVDLKKITVDYVNTKENIADMLTKALGKPEFVYLRQKASLKK